MSSRDVILRAVCQNLPDTLPLPTVPEFERDGSELATAFAEAVARSGGEAVAAAPEEVANLIAARFPGTYAIASMATEVVEGTIELHAVRDPCDLADLGVLVVRGVLGVAENGAVWLPESRLGHRTAPFIAEHLAVVLDTADLVWNLHEAYARIDVAAEGYGVFIAGPSKTADIEQSLVVGAHGPRSLIVFML